MGAFPRHGRRDVRGAMYIFEERKAELMTGDTIAAVSTPRGKGGVALLRVSGPDALRIGGEVFCPKNGRPLAQSPARTAVYGSIYAVEPDGSRVAVDDGLATVFPAPASYTGEDTVEICCHGGILLTETVLSALLAAGARPAGPGEFTRRAFLNGKLGLSAAEALADLLEAQTRDQLLLAHSGMGGATQSRCDELYERLRRILASVYVCIDYPDEDLAEMSRDELIAAMQSCAHDLQELCRSYRTGHAVAEGLRTVICGKPNVGKSALFNRLLGREAAIVTDVEGTTRDVLRGTASLGGVTLLLSDTAGIHETGDTVERIGVERAKSELEQAELTLAVFDASREPDDADRALFALLARQSGEVIALLGKCDLPQTCADAYRARFRHCLPVSARSGEGLPELAGLVERLFLDGRLDIRQDAVLTNARQYAAAVRAQRAMEESLEAFRIGEPIDVCCAGAEGAMAALGELDGRAVSEELVSEIFSHFCVGK